MFKDALQCHQINILGQVMTKANKKNAGLAKQALMAKSTAAIQQFIGDSKTQFRCDLPQEEKISHALQKLLENEMPDGSSEFDYGRALRLIVMAWNISLHDPEEQSRLIREIMTEHFEAKEDSIKQEMVWMLERLIISKEVFFPDDKRLVVFAELKRKGSKVFVSAAGLSPPGDKNLAVVKSDDGTNAE